MEQDTVVKPENLESSPQGLNRNQHEDGQIQPEVLTWLTYRLT